MLLRLTCGAVVVDIVYDSLRAFSAVGSQLVTSGFIFHRDASTDSAWPFSSVGYLSWWGESMWCFCSFRELLFFERTSLCYGFFSWALIFVAGRSIPFYLHAKHCPVFEAYLLWIQKHNCAILINQQVKCWGSDDNGQVWCEQRLLCAHISAFSVFMKFKWVLSFSGRWWRHFISFFWTIISYSCCTTERSGDINGWICELFRRLRQRDIVRCEGWLFLLLHMVSSS